MDEKILENELREGRLSLGEALERVESRESRVENGEDVSIPPTSTSDTQPTATAEVDWDGQGDRDPGEAWKNILIILRELMRDTPWTFSGFVRPLRVLSYREGVFVLAAEGDLERAWCEARLGRTIERVLAGVLNMAEVRVRFVVEDGTQMAQKAQMDTDI